MGSDVSEATETTESVDDLPPSQVDLREPPRVLLHMPVDVRNAALAVLMVLAVLAVLRWAEDKHLFVLGLLSIAAATIARTAMRHRWRRYLPTHIIFMGASYVLMLTAFYVDNGKSLPLWKSLPTIVYWLLPSVVGVPLIVRALRSSPSRQ